MFLSRIYDKYVFKKAMTCFVLLVLGFFSGIALIDSTANMSNITSLELPFWDKMKGVLEYYMVMVFRYLDVFLPALLLITIVVTLTAMENRKEVISLMAMGISPARFTLPLIVCGLIASGLFTAFRELYLPNQLERMMLRSKEFIAGVEEYDVYRILDDDVQITIDGDKLNLLNGTLIRAKVALPQDFNEYGNVINADSAVFNPSLDGRPAGWLLRGVTSPTEMLKNPSIKRKGDENERIVIYTPYDDHLLKSDELYITTNITPRQMVGGSNWVKYASLQELFDAIDDPSHSNHVSEIAASIYTRMVRPFSDILPIFIGISLFSLGVYYGRPSSKMYGYSFLITVCYVAVTAFLAPMLANKYRSAAIAVWGPLVIFLPVTANLYCEIFRKRE